MSANPRISCLWEVLQSSHITLFTVLDTAAGVWCDIKSVVTTPRTGRYSADAAGGDASVELTRRCRHAAAAVGDLIFIYGGLRGGESQKLFIYPLALQILVVQIDDKEGFSLEDRWYAQRIYNETSTIVMQPKGRHLYFVVFK